uniref:Uncharacterized protein n=1 Tax=Aliivibrio wodanis TaxID=80852 RepID=A0A5Q4ZY26_9GAMM|nr:hypothetical protein AW0309160_04262 [Aliivibrio wodanis]
MYRVLNHRYFFTITVLFSSYLSASDTIKLAYSDVESYPFQVGNGHQIANPPGLSVDVINNAANQLNIDIDYMRLPGKRVLQYVKEGKVDGAFIFSYNSQRARYAVYPMHQGRPDNSKRIATLAYYFYKIKGKPFMWDGSEINGHYQKIIGANLGFSIVNELKKKALEVEEINSTAQLFGMLRTERLSAIAMQDSMADEFIKKNKWDDVEQIQPPIMNKDYYLVFSHEFAQSNPELVEQIWTTIDKTRESVISQKRELYDQ